MRIIYARSGFQRRPVQRLLLGVGVIGVVAIAAVGAVVGLALLTVGALAHFGYRGLRDAFAPRVGTRRDGNVIDGEYTVVAHRAATRSLPRAG
jgi:hypothetical protein